jgi:Associated with zinc fingers
MPYDSNESNIEINPLIVDPELRQALRKAIQQARDKEMGRNKRTRSAQNSPPDSPSKENKKCKGTDQPSSPQPGPSTMPDNPRPKSPNSMFLDSILSPNRFSPIRVEEREEMEPEVLAKPPPLVFKNIQFVQLCKLIKEILPESQFELKTQSKVNTAVFLTSSEDYRKAVKVCREKKIDFHCYQLKEDKPFRVVIKNIHPTTPHEMIQQDIEQQGNFIVRQITCVRQRQSRELLPLHFVDLEKGPNNKEIFCLKKIAYFKVKIEEPHHRDDIPQCHRCQAYGHTRSYCEHAPKCVKCAGNHLSAECTKTRDIPAKCANCGESHPASYRGCGLHKKLQEKNKKPEPTQPRGVRPLQQPFTGLSDTDLPPLARNQTTAPQTSAPPPFSYASVTRGAPNNPPRSLPTFIPPRSLPTFIPPPSSSTDIIALLESFIEKIRVLIDPIIRLLSTFSSLIPANLNP